MHSMSLLLGAPPNLVDGWLGTDAQLHAVEEMFGVTIARDSVEQGLWVSNFWTPLVSTEELCAPGRAIAHVASLQAEPAIVGCFVRWRISPAYQLGAPGMRSACIEFFEQCYLEHHNPQPTARTHNGALEAAQRRVMPSSVLWQVCGYVSSDCRVVRQLFPDRGVDVHGLPLDLRDAPVQGGDTTATRFALVRALPQTTPHRASRHARHPGAEAPLCHSITYWGRVTVHVALQVRRGKAAWPPEPPGAPAFAEAESAYHEVSQAAQQQAEARRRSGARAGGRAASWGR